MLMLTSKTSQFRSRNALALVIGGLFGVSALIGLAAPAEAKIKCRGPYQLVSGQPIATPYCGDAHLAKVAISYGFKTSAREIRQSFARKQQICQLIGQDIRVLEICESSVPHYRGRGF